ncbi:restriction endonuclease subunit S [Vibrio cholerae]|uniref:restriction endonuclease subunit S n=1 Tax=Vibrio cholerae TaxID=666 RepID=UPI000E0C4A3B|nr:restriction endonuclease subunit S [Vibrio cholerae]USN27108.1 restriction endonuclease subunit S [synthetic construct]EGQ8411579.1 restriction endonuclease subunit S [Vibrio cholerae]EKF9287190.1 restriction endonuclease subunit S [Vibrio cholerae]EKF9288641.1 restriction endonuclease subunit S [Vibrio cholerae]ELA6196836.1 restriction endonuclease subunit S [Vibrio cholerae]
MSAEKLITDHIDIWTSAVQAKSSSGRGSGKKREIYGIKKLRELILELAVRGKLVPQDPSDEPASVLLERIAAEKAQLVKDGRLKKQKPLPNVEGDEFLFELPNGWDWTRLGNISEIAPKNPHFDDNELVSFVPMPLISTSYKGTHSFEERKWGEVKKGYTHFADGDIAIAKITPCFENSKAAVFSGLINGVGTGTTELHVARPIEGTSDPLFILLYLKSPMFLKVGETKMTGSAGQKRVPKDFFAGNPLPLPPLQEQHRIVAKVDELMALCDQLDQQTEASLDAHQVLVETLLATLTNSQDATELMANWARISEHFDTLFTTEQSIDQLKQTILQLAVMGKLVPQDPNDEPAAKLLERIAEEKAQLVKEKKIKKQKALPPIADDEKPFELPNGWVWARIFDASLFSEYGSSEKTVTELPDGVPVLKMGDIQAGKVILGEHQVVSAQIEDLPNLYLKFGDVLYNRTNSAELVGKTGMFKGEDDVYTFASYLIRIRCSFNNVMPEYLSLSMNTPLFRKTQIEPHIKQQCGQANVNGTLMKHMLVSVPPVREQARLMAKTKELLSFCDQLKQRLRDSQQTQLQLTDAIVEQAL